MDKLLVKRPLSSPVASQAPKKAKRRGGLFLITNERSTTLNPADIFYVDDKTAYYALFPHPYRIICHFRRTQTAQYAIFAAPVPHNIDNMLFLPHPYLPHNFIKCWVRYRTICPKLPHPKFTPVY